MNYIYKGSKVDSLPNFLKNNGSNFVIFWNEDMDREDLLLIPNEVQALTNLYTSNRNKQSYCSNIGSNIFLHMKEFFIPYKQQPPQPVISDFISKRLYFIDFVDLSYSDTYCMLTVTKEESGSKVKIPMKKIFEVKEKFGIIDLGLHIILRNKDMNTIFEPLYHIDKKYFYHTGVKAISKYNIFTE